MKKEVVVAYRADDRVCVETFDGTKVEKYYLSDASARRLATQLVTATVGDEHLSALQEGSELARKGVDFFAQLRKIARR